MALFVVTVTDPAKPSQPPREVRVTAPSRQEARLRAEGGKLRAVSVHEVRPAPAAGRPAEAGAGSKGRRADKPIPRKEIIKLFRGLSSMLRARIDTATALEFYRDGHPSENIRAVLEGIINRLRNGMEISEAFTRSGRFDDTICGIIRAGSESGSLDKAFTSIADRIHAEDQTRAKIRKVVIVPAITVVVLIAAFIFSMTTVTPQVEHLLRQAGQTPDPFSGLMFAISHAVRVSWVFVVPAMIFAAAYIAYNRPVQAMILDAAMSKWRLLNRLIMGLRQLYFIGMLELLYSNGIQLAKALPIAARAISGTRLEEEIIEAGRRYENTGMPLSEAFKHYTSLDRQVSHLVSVSERGAKLDEQLRLLRDMYQEDTSQLLDDFTTAISLITLIFAVLLIGFVYIGSMLPILFLGPRMMKGAAL